MKYIIVETDDVAFGAVLFDDAIAHDEMAAGVPTIKKVKSAGFIELIRKDDKFDIRCTGRSISLGLESNPEMDTMLVKRCLNRNFKDLDTITKEDDE